MGKKEWADNSVFEYIFNFIKEKKIQETRAYSNRKKRCK